MNDGLLVQSYMAVYGTDFSDATKIVDKTVKELLSFLHEDGKADLPNVGELRYSIHDTYDFVPYNNKITTPHLYGLDCFEMQELTVLRKPYDNKAVPFTPAVRKEKKRAYRIGINPSYLTNAAAMIAIVDSCSFSFLHPLENTEVVEANYARLLPGDLFEQIEKQSFGHHSDCCPSATSCQESKSFSGQSVADGKQKTVASVAVKEVKSASSLLRFLPAALKRRRHPLFLSLNRQICLIISSLPV